MSTTIQALHILEWVPPPPHPPKSARVASPGSRQAPTSRAQGVRGGPSSFLAGLPLPHLGRAPFPRPSAAADSADVRRRADFARLVTGSLTGPPLGFGPGGIRVACPGVAHPFTARENVLSVRSLLTTTSVLRTGHCRPWWLKHPGAPLGHPLGIFFTIGGCPAHPS